MEGIIWLVLLCGLAIMGLVSIGLSRRMLLQGMPETLCAIAVLQSAEDLQQQLRGLAAQVLWTDSALVQTIWLVDATSDGSLKPICLEFCRKHPTFQYCTLADTAKIFGN